MSLVAWPAMDRASEPSTRAPGAGALVLDRPRRSSARRSHLRRGRLGSGRDSACRWSRRRSPRRRLRRDGRRVGLRPAVAGSFRRRARRRGDRGRRLDGRDDGVVDRPGPKLGFVQQVGRICRLPRARPGSRRGRGPGCGAPCRLVARAGHRGSARVGAAHESGARTRPGRRSRRPPSRTSGLLERACAPRRHGTRARSLARNDSGTPAQHSRCPQARSLRRDALALAHPLACRCRGSCLGARALARAVARARRVRAPPPRIRRARPARRCLGVHETRSDGRHSCPRGSGRRRHGLRHPRPSRSRSRSAPRCTRLGAIACGRNPRAPRPPGSE